jgi:hypothetical protein
MEEFFVVFSLYKSLVNKNLDVCRKRMRTKLYEDNPLLSVFHFFASKTSMDFLDFGFSKKIKSFMQVKRIISLHYCAYSREN